jgi:carboxyl-terminal processing protease
MMQELLALAADEKIEFNQDEFTRSKALIRLQIKA